MEAAGSTTPTSSRSPKSSVAPEIRADLAHLVQEVGHHFEHFILFDGIEGGCDVHLDEIQLWTDKTHECQLHPPMVTVGGWQLTFGRIAR